MIIKSRDEALNKVAKKLVAVCKEDIKNGKKAVNIPMGFGVCTTQGKRYFTFFSNTKDEIYTEDTTYNGKDSIFADISVEVIAPICNYLANKVTELLKLNKGTMVIPRTEKKTIYGMWSSRNINYTKSLLVIKPVKGWETINKKLVKLSLKPLDPKDIWFGDMNGKRSSYSYSGITYKAVDPVWCDKVLGFLKGKKKLSYEVKKFEDSDNRDYGERYETEWNGSVDVGVVFTDFKGNKVRF